MDSVDIENLTVLAVFGAGLVAVIVGYVVAWKSKQTTARTMGSWMVAAVAGFAGLFMFAWLLGAITPLPPPDGSPLWEPLVFFVSFSPLPLGALYISAKFVRRALRNQHVNEDAR